MKKIIIAALFSAFALNAGAARVGMLDNMTFTINPDIKTFGPVFVNTEAAKDIYGNQVATLLLKNADKVAKKYLKYNDTKAYNAFMTLALTVPMHEGLFVHFREVENEAGLCERGQEVISKYLKPIIDESDESCGFFCRRRARSEAKKRPKIELLFREYLLENDRPLIIKCDKLNKNTPTAKQIVRGADGSDIGMMQVSVRWHYEVFLAQKKYESVAKSMEYGIKHLMKGFDPIYRKAAQFNCMTTNNTFNYQNLIRGTWGGYYNGGSIKQACRFANIDHLNDRGFKRNLDKILAYPETGIIGMHKDLNLRLSGDVKAAVTEVITNLRDGTDNREALKRLLSK